MCDDHGDDDGYDDPDYDPYDFQLESSDSVSEDEDRKGPQPGEIFICVSESSLVPEKILRHGHDEDCVFSFLVRYVGFDHFYDDWVPASKLPAQMIDEYYCSKLGMSAPDLSEIPEDFDSDEEDEFESSFVPLSEKSIKRQLKALGCYQKPRNPLAPPKTSKFSIRNLLLPPVQLDLLDTSCELEQRLLRLQLFNANLQRFNVNRSHKPEPWPPDPPDPTLQTSKSSTFFPSNPAQLSILFPDYLLILASEVQLWNYVPKSLLVSTGDGHGGSHWLAIADQTWITRS